MIYVDTISFISINLLEKDVSIIETRRLKSIVIFIST